MNPYRYRGYYYDSDLQLYYLNSRYYDSEMGRFINADDISVLNESQSILNGLNLFAYCNNNPIMYTDENGQKWWHWLLGIAVIVGAAFFTVVTAGGFAAAGAAFAGVFAGTATGISGFFAGVTVGAAIGGIISSIGGGLSSVLNGDNFWDGAANGFMWGTITGAISGAAGVLKFGDLGLMGARNQFNSIQILLQSWISFGSYTARTLANKEQLTIVGAIMSFLGGIAGGFGMGFKLPASITINASVEIENFLISVFKKVTGIKNSILL